MGRRKKIEPVPTATETDSNNNIVYDNNSIIGSAVSILPPIPQGWKHGEQDKARHFVFVVYPDSAPSDWRDRLIMQGIPFVVSPIHNMDINADGTHKKDHWHVMVSWDNTTTYHAARKLGFDILHSPLPLVVKNPMGMYRYFTHADNPDKYQYTDMPQCYNGWQPPLSEHDIDGILQDIHRLIYTDNIKEYGELMTVCISKGDNYAHVAQTHTMYCNALCRSYRHNPLACLMRYYNTLPDDDATKDDIAARISYYKGDN